MSAVPTLSHCFAISENGARPTVLIWSTQFNFIMLNIRIADLVSEW